MLNQPANKLFGVHGNPGSYNGVSESFRRFTVPKLCESCCRAIHNYAVSNRDNQSGCRTASDTALTVYVIPDYNVFLPSAFTPNGDGKNDYFQLYGNLSAIEYLAVEVYNRWGEEVYQSHDVNFKWDGAYKGVLQNPQVFVWEIKMVFLDGHADHLRTGSLTLMR